MAARQCDTRWHRPFTIRNSARHGPEEHSVSLTTLEEQVQLTVAQLQKRIAGNVIFAKLENVFADIDKLAALKPKSDEEIGRAHV